MTESMSLTEVNKKWKEVSTQNPEAMLDAQNAWYDKYIVPAAQKNLKKVPKKFHSRNLITFLADRTLQLGPYGEGAFSYAAANSKTSSEFITNMVKWDNEHITEIFPTAIGNQKNKDRPRYIASLRQRSAKRGAAGLGIEYVPEQWLSKEDIELLDTPPKQKSRPLKTSDVGTDTIRMANVNENTGETNYTDQNTDQKNYSTVENTQKQINLSNNIANVENVSDMAIYFQKQLEYQRGFA
jgi:hypothetical protein